MMKKSGNVLILLGVLLFGYVAYEQIYARVLERKIISETVQISQSLQEHVQQTMSPTVEQIDTQENMITYPLDLSIPAINLKTKVLEGTSEDILRVAVGHLEGSGELGEEDQNFVVLGHRSHVTGQFFNRLDELTVGDLITLESEKEYLYKVMDIKIIRPNQLEVLNPIKGKEIVTLITCHPKYSNKQRLVVVAERVE
ncbi:class D sortase [Fredinandcohnia humi]